MKNTDDLRQELMESPDLDQFLTDNQEDFDGGRIGEMLNTLFQ